MRLILVPEFDNLYVLHPAALFLFSRTKTSPHAAPHGAAWPSAAAAPVQVLVVSASPA